MPDKWYKERRVLENGGYAGTLELSSESAVAPNPRTNPRFANFIDRRS